MFDIGALQIVRTIGAAFNPHQNNFDIIRLAAASLVVISHSYGFLKYPEPLAYWLGGYETGGGWAVSIFFVISGFLIARSCEQRPILTYVTSRLFRIIPALAVLLLLDVFVVGPIFTSFPLHHYFLNVGIFKHLLNVTVFIQYHKLPGVFNGTGVNGTIWTLPIEFACYLLLPFLAALFLLKQRLVLIPLFITVYLYWSAIQSGFSWNNQGGYIFSGLPYYSTLRNGLFFMIGTTMWVHRNQLPLTPLFAAIALLVLIVGAFGFLKSAAYHIGLSYLTIYCCLARPIPLNLQKWPGDLSYGTYLYGFPIQKAVLFSPLQPFLTPMILTVIALPVTFALAYLSWHFVEKPALTLARRRKMAQNPLAAT